MRRLLTIVVPAFVSVVAMQVVSTGALQAQGAATTRTVYFSAIDDKGAPVTDLTPADLVVKEGGKEYPATSVAPATTPMEVEIIDDDWGTGGFQAAIAQFVQKLFGHGEFGITTLNPQPVKIMDFSSDAKAIQDGVRAVGQRSRVTSPDSNNLGESIKDAAKDFSKRNVQRPVIVALTIAGEHDPSDQATQSVQPDDVLNAVKDSGASLSAVYITNAMTGPILGDGPKHSGGTVEQVGANTGGTDAMVAIADRLLSQEMVTYTVPHGKTSDHFELKTTRKDVKLIAPDRIPKGN